VEEIQALHEQVRNKIVRPTCPTKVTPTDAEHRRHFNPVTHLDSSKKEKAFPSKTQKQIDAKS